MGGIPDPEGYGCSTTLCWTKIQPPDDVATRRNEVYRWREAQACDKEERKVASRLVAVLLKPATRELSEILLGFLVSMLRGHACAPFYIWIRIFWERLAGASAIQLAIHERTLSWQHFRATNRSFGWSDRNSCSFSSSRRRCRWSTVWSIQIRCTHDRLVGERERERVRMGKNIRQEKKVMKWD